MSTRCRTVDELIAAFATLVDEDSLVVLTDQQRVIGSRQPFVVELADGTMVMKGEAEVVESTAPPKGRLRLKFLALDASGRDIHKRMLDRKTGGNGKGRPTTDAGMKPLVRIPEPAKKEDTGKAKLAAVPAVPPVEPKPPAKLSPPLAPRTPQPTPLASIPVIAPRSPTTLGLPTVARPPAKADDAVPVPVTPAKAKVLEVPKVEAPAPADDEKTDVQLTPRPGTGTGTGAGAGAGTASGTASGTIDLGERVPGSPYILPANPFGELAPDQLEAFVECTLYEETGQFEVPDDPELARELGLDDLAEPPAAPPVMPAPAPVPAPPPVPPPVPVVALEPRPTQTTDLTPLGQIARRPMPWIILGALLVVGLLVGIIASRFDHDEAAGVAADAGVAAKVVPAAGPDAAAAAVAPAPDAAVEAAPDDEDRVAAVVPAGVTGDCELSVVVDPVGAPVYLGSRALGNAPVKTAIPCQPARVVVSHPRYQRVEKPIQPEAGAPVQLTLDLERPEMRVTIASKPAGASIEIDGRVVGKAPITTKVKAFTSAKVEARLDGYLTWSEKVYFKKTQPKITARLKKAIRKRN